MLDSYHPSHTKHIPNRLRTCLECENPVYAKYLCRPHYAKRQRDKIREEKAAEKQAKRDALQLKLETEGSYCLVPICAILTLRESGLCNAHEGRATRWQMEPPELVAIFEQNPHCKICGGSESLVLDHLHGGECESTHIGSNGCLSCFRGVLCNGCNSAIGFMKDDPVRLEQGAEYVRQFSQ